jgi:nicotinate (nicotinamide) nucleotide adenylyltransferase
MESDAVNRLVNAKHVNENYMFDAASIPRIKDQLKEQWDSAIAEGQQSANVTKWCFCDAWFDRIYQQHNQEGRFYHTAMHLKEMLEYLQILRQTSILSKQQSLPMVLAIFFHDVVYNPNSIQNEKDSAMLFEEFNQDVGIDTSISKAVVTMILATEKHQILPMPDVDEDMFQSAQAYFLDLDMAVLGKKPEAYLEYAALIRQEFSFVDPRTYCSKRAEILQSFLAKTIFQTRLFQEAMEERARHNLCQEIRLLRQGIIPSAQISAKRKDITAQDDSLDFKEVASNDMTNLSLCQQLRLEVFVQELGVPTTVELDGNDASPLTTHVMVKATSLNSSVIGTGRITVTRIVDGFNDDTDEPYPNASLGRIAIAKLWRRQGIGKKVVQELENIALRRLVHRLQVTPYHYLENYFISLGYTRVPNGNSLVNDGIPLITMVKRLAVSPQLSAMTSPKEQERRLRRRICLFGTSANPPTGTGGHVGVVQALLKMSNEDTNTPKFDEIHVLPVFQHTFSEKRSVLAPYHHRVVMSELAFAGLSESERVVVSRAEERSYHRKVSSVVDGAELASLQVGTADLLEMLVEESKQTNIETEFSFCLGADTFMDLTAWKWRRSEDVMLLLEGRLIVVQRKGMDQGEELLERVKRLNEAHGGRVMFLDVPMLEDISSSKARKANDINNLRQMLPSKVVDYIMSHKLYNFDDTQNSNGLATLNSPLKLQD